MNSLGRAVNDILGSDDGVNKAGRKTVTHEEPSAPFASRGASVVYVCDSMPFVAQSGSGLMRPPTTKVQIGSLLMKHARD